ncbi:MAG: hypothetical protein WCG85_27945 [Polyangia bacterium]
MHGLPEMKDYGVGLDGHRPQVLGVVGKQISDPPVYSMPASSGRSHDIVRLSWAEADGGPPALS